MLKFITPIGKILFVSIATTTLIFLTGCPEPLPPPGEPPGEVENWNLVLGQPISASDFLPEYPPEFVANSPLCWSVEGKGLHWLEIRLDGPAIIDEFQLTIGHDYEGEPIDIYGRPKDGNLELLHRFENEQLLDGNKIEFKPEKAWTEIEMIRMESPESPITLCWRDLGLIGRIPGRDAPDLSDLCLGAPRVIYHNGTIITMDPSNPVAEAIGIGGNKIEAVGSNTAVLDLGVVGCGTRTIDLEGKTILPGFNDNHTHWFSWREHECFATGDTLKTYPPLGQILDTIKRNGWTSISSLAFGLPVTIPQHLDSAMEFDSRGKLPFRLTGYWGGIGDLADFDQLAGYSRNRYLSERIRAVGVKIYVDGPFGTSDILSQTEVNALVSRAHADGWSMAAHAVNVSAVEKIVTAYENVLGFETNENYRHRIEHSVKVADMPLNQFNRIRNKGIILSFQLLGPPDWPLQETFQNYLSNTNPEWVLRWRDFVVGGVRSVGSTDAPFNNAPCDYSPFRVIYQAVTRIGYLRTPTEPWEFNQRLEIEQAIKLLTLDGAYATFEENRKGSITPNKWADLVIVSANPLEVAAPENLLDIDILLTMVGGQMEYVKTGYEVLNPSP